MKEIIIKLDNVNFGYSSDRLSLENMSLEIPTGLKAAFIGPNGAGKSTLFFF